MSSRRSPSGADARVAAGVQIARFREVLAEVRAAAVLARQRRHGDDPGDIDQAFQVEPVVPGQVIAAVAIGHADAAQRGTVGLHGVQAALHRGALAQHAGVVPHGPRQLVAQFMDAAGRLRKGYSARSMPRAMRADPDRASAFAATCAAIESPAMPPNTVEFATPLPPSRLAPCTPPQSSPAAYSPGDAVEPSTLNSTPPIR